MDPNPTPEVSYTPPRAWGQDETAAPVGDPTIPSPTFSETLPPTVSPATVPTSPPELRTENRELKSSSIGRTLLIGVALILLGTLIGVLAARFLPMTTNTLIPLPPITLTPTVFETIIIPTIEITPIPTPTATPSALLDLKWNMMTVKSPLTAFSDYKIYYPTTWTIKEYKNTTKADDTGSSTLTLTKGKISLNILQNTSDSLLCFFPKDNAQEGSGFIQLEDYREIAKPNLVLWRWALQIVAPQPIIPDYRLCEQIGGSFTTGTRIGMTTISGENIDESTLDEINYILEKIVIL